MEDIDDILQLNGLKKTNMRRDVLSLIVASEHSLSQSFIEEQLVNSDRVTVYRTLNTFENAGLIHRITGKENEITYAYCADHCHDGQHEDNHVHFSCNKCDKTYCLDHVVPSIETPEGYIVSQVNTLVEGICASCSG